jgi:hypothetical protein
MKPISIVMKPIRAADVIFDSAICYFVGFLAGMAFIVGATYSWYVEPFQEKRGFSGSWNVLPESLAMDHRRSYAENRYRRLVLDLLNYEANPISGMDQERFLVECVEVDRAILDTEPHAAGFPSLVAQLPRLGNGHKKLFELKN